MNVLRDVYDFVTGGSFVTPVGLIVAILTTSLCMTHGVGARGAGFALLGVLALTFLGSVLEGAR